MPLLPETGLPKINLSDWNNMVDLVNSLESANNDVTDLEAGAGITLAIVNGKLRITSTATGSGSGYAAILDYNTTTNTWPAVPSTIGPGPILWRGPSTASAPQGARLGDDVDLSY